MRIGLTPVAVTRSGLMLNDLVIRRGKAAVHVLSVPSTGPTAALVLADDIVSFARHGTRKMVKHMDKE